MTQVSRTYHDHFLHTHFVAVHLAGLFFGLHLVLASAFAVYHHARRSNLLAPVLHLSGPANESAPEAGVPRRDELERDRAA